LKKGVLYGNYKKKRETAEQLERGKQEEVM